MPFGLCNAPSTFQATMNTFLQPYLWKFIAVFFNDILVYSATLKSHLHLRVDFHNSLAGVILPWTLQGLFAQWQMEYLGHVISTNRIEPDHSKIIVMLEWPVPNNQRDLRGFLGLTGFYRKFIKGYAAIVAPLTSLLCKNNFSWTPETQKVFEWLKVAMTNAPVLAIPNFSLPFILETDLMWSLIHSFYLNFWVCIRIWLFSQEKCQKYRDYNYIFCVIQ